MASYKKHPSKSHNSKANAKASHSATKEIFTNLDTGAYKAENWVLRHNKLIIAIIIAGVVLGGGYMLYSNYVQRPKEAEAEKELFFVRQAYQKAMNAPENQKDSLYSAALGDDDSGLLRILNKYSGTAAANEAHYLSGMAYMNTGKYTEAIEELKKFSTDEMIIGPLALGAIGDAYSELGDYAQAVEYYKKASEKSKNDFTSPRFMLKIAGLAINGQKDKALAISYLNKIKTEYPEFSKANQIDALLLQAESKP